MSILRPRRTLVAAAVAGTAIAGALGVGTAAHAATSGVVTLQMCNQITGNVNYTPGLQSSTAQSVRAILTATVNGCSGEFSGAENGTGTFDATMTGNASLAAENFAGTFTLNWPAGANLFPSNGTVKVTDNNGVEQLLASITSGAYSGTQFGFSYIPTSSTTSTMQVSSTSSHSNGHHSSKKHTTSTVTVTTAQAITGTSGLAIRQNEG
ncbi:MAG TPA: hypothetical protein VHF26_22755 [Trebonia sp.]|nr:hypothetical protein [Trebonia sp.]